MPCSDRHESGTAVSERKGASDGAFPGCPVELGGCPSLASGSFSPKRARAGGASPSRLMARRFRRSTSVVARFTTTSRRTSRSAKSSSGSMSAERLFRPAPKVKIRSSTRSPSPREREHGHGETCSSAGGALLPKRFNWARPLPCRWLRWLSPRLGRRPGDSGGP
jgi:hypothetical protein